MSFGRLRESSSLPAAEINMIPLIDVMLVLLVIFILTAPLVTQSVKLELPETVDLKEKPKPLEEKVKPIMIAINSDNEVFVNETLTSEGDMLEVLGKLKLEADQESPMVQLHIDSSVPYEYVAKVITDLSKVGLPNIGFISIPEEEVK